MSYSIKIFTVFVNNPYDFFQIGPHIDRNH